MHVKRLTGIRISDSALAQRRVRLPWQMLEETLQVVLRPLAEPNKQPGAFYRGLRLVVLDGTMLSVCNTPRISKSLKTEIHVNWRLPAVLALPPAAVERIKRAGRCGLVEPVKHIRPPPRQWHNPHHRSRGSGIHTHEGYPAAVQP